MNDELCGRCRTSAPEPGQSLCYTCDRELLRHRMSEVLEAAVGKGWLTASEVQSVMARTTWSSTCALLPTGHLRTNDGQVLHLVSESEHAAFMADRERLRRVSDALTELIRRKHIPHGGKHQVLDCTVCAGLAVLGTESAA